MEIAVLAQGAHTFTNSLIRSAWPQPELQHCKHAHSPLPSRLAQHARARDPARAQQPGKSCGSPRTGTSPSSPTNEHGRHTHLTTARQAAGRDVGRTAACAAHSACSSAPSGERSRNASRNAGACGPCRELRSSPRPAHVARVRAAATARVTATALAVNFYVCATVCVCCCCVALGLAVPPLSHISHCAVLAVQDLQSLWQQCNMLQFTG